MVLAIVLLQLGTPALTWLKRDKLERISQRGGHDLLSPARCNPIAFEFSPRIPSPEAYQLSAASTTRANGYMPTRISYASSLRLPG